MRYFLLLVLIQFIFMNSTHPAKPLSLGSRFSIFMAPRLMAIGLRLKGCNRKEERDIWISVPRGRRDRA